MQMCTLHGPSLQPRPLPGSLGSHRVGHFCVTRQVLCPKEEEGLLPDSQALLERDAPTLGAVVPARLRSRHPGPRCPRAALKATALEASPAPGPLCPGLALVLLSLSQRRPQTQTFTGAGAAPGASPLVAGATRPHCPCCTGEAVVWSLRALVTSPCP